MMNYAIETHHLKKVYKDKIVVNDVNIHVKKGEIYGFVGPNGAGKSTLMKMLLNLVQANSGEIVIFGNKVIESDFEILKRIGSIIENPYFYEKLTARENLDLHCEYMGYHNKNHIKEVLECVGLLKDVHKFQTDYVEVEVDNIELAGYVLEHECGIRNFKIVSENRIEIYDLGKAVKEISALLVQNGVGINSIGRKQNSLEDYFFQITGTEVVENL